MKIETCYNCERAIGKLERAYIYNGSVVCEQCYDKLQTKSTAIPDRGMFLGDKELQREVSEIDKGKVIATSLIFISIIIAIFTGYLELALLLIFLLACFSRPLRKAGGLVMIIGGIFTCFLFLPLGLISIFVGGIFMFN